MVVIRATAALIVAFFIAEVRCETVDVRYHGLVDLKHGAEIFGRRAHYHYCELPTATFDSLMDAIYGPVLPSEHQEVGLRQIWSNSSPLPLMSVERLIIVS